MLWTINDDRTDQNPIDEQNWFVLWKLRSIWIKILIAIHCMQLEFNWGSIIQLNFNGMQIGGENIKFFLMNMLLDFFNEKRTQIQKGNFLYLSTWEWDKQILVWNYPSNDLNLMKSKVGLPN